MITFRQILISASMLAIAGGCSREEIVIDGDDLTKEAADAAKASGYEPSWLMRDTLRIYSWEDYFAPHVIASFEKALNVKVVIDVFESNEEMLEKMQSGEGDYDIITPSSYIIPTLAAEELITKMNHLHLPNVRKNFDARLKPLLIDPLMTFNVPYSVSHTLIHYDRSQIPEGVDPCDYAIFENPALKGRTAIMDDIRETLGLALMHLGHSINSSNPDEINAAADLVIKWKRNCGRCDTSLYDEDVRSGRIAVAMSYSDLAQISYHEHPVTNRENGAVQEIAIPKGNFSLSVDEFVIVAGTPNKELAHAFINYFYDVNVASSSMKSRFAAIPVRPAFEKLSPELKEKIALTPEQLKRGQVIMGFNNRPKVEKLYEDAWERVKAAK